MIGFIRDEPIISAFIAVTLLVVLFCIGMAVREDLACKARGGQMVGTGEYYTTVTMVGKVPVVNTYEHTTCSVPG